MISVLVMLCRDDFIDIVDTMFTVWRVIGKVGEIGISLHYQNKRCLRPIISLDLNHILLISKGFKMSISGQSIPMVLLIWMQRVQYGFN